MSTGLAMESCSLGKEEPYSADLFKFYEAPLWYYTVDSRSNEIASNIRMEIYYTRLIRPCFRPCLFPFFGPPFFGAFGASERVVCQSVTPCRSWRNDPISEHRI